MAILIWRKLKEKIYFYYFYYIFSTKDELNAFIIKKIHGKVSDYLLTKIIEEIAEDISSDIFSNKN